ncbi:MAG: S8/S53 family peptidase [Pseudomonadota bacterium]|nr:S8/S53 family peptidase [Pseudomonadota bacterium]
MAVSNYTFQNRAMVSELLLTQLLRNHATYPDELIGVRFTQFRETALLLDLHRVLFFNSEEHLVVFFGPRASEIEFEAMHPFKDYRTDLPQPRTSDADPTTRARNGAPLRCDAGASPSSASGEGVTVAIVDSGLSAAVKLKGKLIAHSFVDNDVRSDLSGHGTQVATFISGTSENQSGATDVEGICPSANVVFAKSHVYGAEINPGVVEIAIAWVLKAGADIVNVSLGYARLINTPSSLDTAIDNVLRAYPCATLFAAAGHDHTNHTVGIHSPASASLVEAVAAFTDCKMDKYPHNDHPRCDDISCVFCSGPGYGVGALEPSNQDVIESTFYGTSAACAFVSGIAALHLETLARPIKDREVLLDLLKKYGEVPTMHWEPCRGGFGKLTRP